MNEKDYSDIIDLAYPRPSRYPRMSLKERAAQFSPFAALTGYGDAIQGAVETIESDYIDQVEDLYE